MNAEYVVLECCWANHKEALSSIRRHVFIEEQNVPEELEWDEFDESASHVLVSVDKQQTVATGRIKTDGHIGRMAVLAAYRKQGIGSEILLTLLNMAKNKNIKSVYLHAQVSAIGFYEKHGFICSSQEFLDAGIPHKSMLKKLT